MKHFLTGAAVVAALAISAPVSAQPASPSGGAPTPYATGTPPPAPTPSGRMPSGGKKLSGSNTVPTAASTSETTSATPPAHRHARVHHAMHGHMAHGPGPKSATDTTAQLNQAELARLQAGAAPMAPQMAPQMAPPPSAMSGGNSLGLSGPNTGGPGLTPYSGGAPQR